MLQQDSRNPWTWDEMVREISQVDLKVANQRRLGCWRRKRKRKSANRKKRRRRAFSATAGCPSMADDVTERVASRKCCTTAAAEWSAATHFFICRTAPSDGPAFCARFSFVSLVVTARRRRERGGENSAGDRFIKKESRAPFCSPERNFFFICSVNKMWSDFLFLSEAACPSF